MAEKHTVGKCSACGTSPVNHNFIFTLNILEETIGVLSDKVFSFTNTPRWQKLTILVEKTLFTIITNLGIVRFKDDIEKAGTGRSKLVWEEAKLRGIKMQQLYVFGKNIEFYRAKIKGKMVYYPSIPIPDHLSQGGYRWLDDKFKLFEVLSKENVPVPKANKFFTLKNALESFKKMDKPVIIKPQHGSRGRHTTTNINTEKELEKAFSVAREITLFMVMQEHLFGSVYRATVINKKLVGFFRADPPQITGDGIKTIKELIEEKNKLRPDRLSPIMINDDLTSFIKRLGYTIDDILEKNKMINLSAKTGRMYGGYTEEMLPKVHPKMHEIFQKAGELVDAPVVGFDLIIEDPTQDPDKQKWGIIECNSLPFIDLHYFALVGKPVNLAKNVWDLWN
jgi:cyanophycin synthetase